MKTITSLAHPQKDILDFFLFLVFDHNGEDPTPGYCFFGDFSHPKLSFGDFTHNFLKTLGFKRFEV